MALQQMPGVPMAFERAREQLRTVRLRPEVHLDEVPAPTRIAPYAVALAGEVIGPDDQELASGRFVLLHDPAGQDAWDGPFRVVAFAKAAVDPELGEDPMLGQVGWSWLNDALAQCGAPSRCAGGTVTRVVSDSFGALADKPGTADVEVRASWTPDGDLGAHLSAWSTLLCAVAGLPPLPPGVAPLSPRAM